MRAGGIALAAAGAAAAALGALPAAGQNRPGAPLLTLGVTTGVSAHDNVRLDADGGDSVVTGNARLDFAYAAGTRLQSLTVTGDVGLRGVAGGGDDDLDGLDGPRLRFGYERAVPDARLSVDGFVNRSRVAFSTLELIDLVDLDDPGAGSVDLIEESDEGTRLTFGLDGRLELRRDAPFGIDLFAGVGGDRYGDGATDGDEDRVRAGIGLRFDLDPVTQARLDVVRSVFDQEPDAGATADPEERRTTTVTARLTRQLETGQVGLSLRAAETEDGERYGLSVSHTRRTALWTLTGRAGLSRETSGDVSVVGGLSVARTLERGRLGLTLDRRVISGEDDEERRLTTLRLDYGLDLSPLTSLTADANVQRSATTGDGAREDETAGSVGVALNRRLTERTTVSAGLRHRFEDDGDGDTARDNVLSLNLRRAVSFRP